MWLVGDIMFLAGLVGLFASWRWDDLKRMKANSKINQQKREELKKLRTLQAELEVLQLRALVRAAAQTTEALHLIEEEGQDTTK